VCESEQECKRYRCTHFTTAPLARTGVYESEQECKRYRCTHLITAPLARTGVYESELERTGNVYMLRDEPPHRLHTLTTQAIMAKNVVGFQSIESVPRILEVGACVLCPRVQVALCVYACASCVCVCLCVQVACVCGGGGACTRVRVVCAFIRVYVVRV